MDDPRVSKVSEGGPDFMLDYKKAHAYLQQISKLCIKLHVKGFGKKLTLQSGTIKVRAAGCCGATTSDQRVTP
jgi:hypothetical protein